MGKKKNIYRLLVSKTAGKRPLGKPGSKGLRDVKMNFKEMGQKGVSYIHLVRNGDKRRAIVSTVINCRIL
jgi:hypothetical protein